MILVDTGPLVALFDPQDKHHARCSKTLRTIRVPLRTTTPVLTEAFHMLHPASQGADRLRDFLSAKGGITTWHMSAETLRRALELMETYRDRPMDLADASLIVAAEVLQTRKIFTIDRDDFQTYRIRRGHRLQTVEIVF